MNFSGIPEKWLFGKILRLPLRLIPPKTQIPILQGRLKGKKWIVGSGNHGYWLGSYEYHKQLLIQKTIKPGSVVFDIGGNVGFYSLLASELVGLYGRVFTFEPLPRNLFYLKEHVRLNHITNVTIIEAAVSDQAGLVRFDEGPNSSMGKIAKQGSLEVTSIVLDVLYRNQQIPSPDYLKIDIEGSEFSALNGAKAILETLHPVIFLATHGSIVHRDCVQLLQSFGYQIHSINEELNLEQSDELIAIIR